MIEGGKNIEKVVVEGNFTGIERAVDGVGFSLEPVSEGARYPVHVVVNGNTAKPVVVEGPGWYSQDGRVTHLKVDVTPGGGQAGDTWRLFTRPTEGDRERQRFVGDEKGNLCTSIVGTTGWKTLFELDSDVVAQQLMFVDAFEGGATGVFYILPAAPEVLTLSASTRTPAWDVSRWANVMMVIDQELREGADGADCILSMGMEVTHAEEGAKATKLFGAGTNGNFGIGGLGTVWDQTSTGFIHLGSGKEETEDFNLSTATKHPYARFYLNMAGSNTEAWDTYFATRRLWVRALVW